MSSKNNSRQLSPLATRPENAHIPSAQAVGSLLPSSLRLRLMLWYGTLLVIALILLVSLVLLLTRDAIYQSLDAVLRTESRATQEIVKRAIETFQKPDWYRILTLDPYRNPGIAIKIESPRGTMVYSSDGSTQAVILPAEVQQRIERAEMPPTFEATVDGNHAKVQASPILHIDKATGTKTVSGVLVVVQSLKDADKAFFAVQTFLLVLGLTVLFAALLGGWILTSRVLHPLSEIVQTARTIATNAHGTQIGSLSQRVHRPTGNDEMAQVVDTFNEMLAALESASQAQKRFIADASHELRAPLTTIRGNLSFLERRIDEIPLTESKTMLGDAHEETLRLARLVDELLLLARADVNTSKQTGERLQGEQEDAKKQVQLVELDHVVLQLVRQMRGRLELDGSKLKLSVGHIEPARVNGSEESIRRILLALLDNALKYTASYREDGSGIVKVSIQRQGDEVLLQVEDNGMGIDAKDLPHIFERFYRADETRDRAGTGLGLAIAQTLVEELNGHISAQSTSGKGSIFTVTLPLSHS